MMNSKGILFVFSAPSGCGKGTVLPQVLKNHPEVHYSVSATTRQKREGEVDGVNYYFVSKAEFEEMIATGGVLEYAEYCGNYYGTPRKIIEEKLESGISVLLEIETIGAMKVKEAFPEAVCIFMLPPSISDLDKRLHNRGTDSDEVIAKRIAEATQEINKSFLYDFVFVNDDLKEAQKDLDAILTSAKYLTKVNTKLIKGVL